MYGAYTVQSSRNLRTNTVHFNMSTTPKFDITNLEVEFSVTRENFKFPAIDGTPVYLQFKQPIVEDTTGLGERIRRVRSADGTLVPAENKEPIFTSVIVDLQTGEECNILVHKLFLKALTDKYTGTDYVDKILMVVRNSAKSGRGVYHTFVVKQMRLKQPEVTQQPVAPVVNSGASQTKPATQQRAK